MNRPQVSAIAVTSAGRSYSLSYFDRPGHGPTILYVHGLGCSKADFMELTSAPELQSFRLVSADHPGCGDSSYDENHSLNIDGVVELIENFVAHLQLDRFLLVGGSMGGLVALLYAERNLNKIAGFANVEGNLAPEDCMFSRTVIPHSYSHFEEVVFPRIKKELSAKAGRGFAQHLRVLEKANPRAYYDYSFQTVEYSDQGNLLERFLSLPVPKCFLYGSENRHLAYLQRLRESKCTVIEVPDANHFLFYDEPNHYAAALASFARNSVYFQLEKSPSNETNTNLLVSGAVGVVHERGRASGEDQVSRRCASGPAAPQLGLHGKQRDHRCRKAGSAGFRGYA
jgi:pimeloyl-ACP methyl ester carboxylesterase